MRDAYLYRNHFDGRWLRSSHEEAERGKERETGVKSGRRLLRRSRRDKRKLSSRQEQEEETAATGIRGASEG